MGNIRLLLALAVTLAHSGLLFGFKHIDGEIAVESFFIISGFYMSLILNEKYSGPKNYGVFIRSRLLRIYPAYFVVIGLSLLFVLLYYGAGIKQEIISDFLKINSVSKLYALIINTVIIGQDTALFLGFNAQGYLHFVKDYTESSPAVFTFLLCPPAWTLSLELMFYAIAPFVVKKKLGAILFLMFLSLLLRLYIHSRGLIHDPWTHRFFPTELFFFLAGNVSYKMYAHLDRFGFLKRTGAGIFMFMIVLICAFNSIPMHYEIKQYGFYFAFICSIPFIFNRFKKNALDRFIGELSYPVYLSNLFIISFCIPANTWLGKLQNFNPLIALVFTIAFSYSLVIILIKPIDNYRHTKLLKQSR
jgi:peptidoglycan/LPS O-acetylase OafA/YrhL